MSNTEELPPLESAQEPEASPPRGRGSSALPSSESWIFAALGGLVSYVAVFVLALVVVLLALLSLKNVDIDWSWLFLFPAQLVGLSLGGVFALGGTFAGVGVSISLLWAPALLTAASVLAIVLVSRREEKARPSEARSTRWVLSGSTGLALAVASVVFALILQPRFAPGSAASSQFADSGLDFSKLSVSGTSASVSLFLVALAIGTLAAYLARRSVASKARSRSTDPIAIAVRAVVAPAVLYVAVASIILGIVFLIAVPIKSGASFLLSAPLWLPTLVADAFALINFSLLSIGGALAFLLGASAAPVSMVGSLPWWATAIAIVVNLVLLLASAIALRLRRADNAVGSWSNWLATVGSFAVVGIILTLVGSIAGWSHVDTSALTSGSSSDLLGAGAALFAAAASTSVSFGPAAWTVLVFAVVGAIVELFAIFVAPLVIARSPAPLLARSGSLLAKVGVPLVTEQVSPTGDGAAAPDTVPMTPARRKLVVRLVIGIGGLIVVIILASVAISVVNGVVFSPEKQVTQYLSAVQAKDATAAVALGNVNASRAKRVLLTDAVLKSTSGGLDSFTVLSTRTAGSLAVVSVRATQDGSKATATYTVRNTGKTWLFFDKWELDPVALPEIQIDVPAGVSALSINGATVPVTAGDHSDGLQLSAFPGRYEVGIGGDTKWVTAKKASALVPLDGSVEPGYLSLKVVPTAALISSVNDQVSALIVKCLSSTDAAPVGCPFQGYSLGDSGVIWAAGTAPTFTLQSDSKGAWSVYTDKAGSVTMSSTWHSGFGDYSYVDPESVYVDGTVSFVKGKPVYALVEY